MTVRTRCLSINVHPIIRNGCLFDVHTLFQQSNTNLLSSVIWVDYQELFTFSSQKISMKIWAMKTLVQLLNHSSGLSNGLIIRISMVSAISWMMQVLECCSTTKQNYSCHPMEGECFQPFHDATWNFMIADSNLFFLLFMFAP